MDNTIAPDDPRRLSYRRNEFAHSRPELLIRCFVRYRRWLAALDAGRPVPVGRREALLRWIRELTEAAARFGIGLIGRCE